MCSRVTCWDQKYHLSHIEGNELEVCNFSAQIFYHFYVISSEIPYGIGIP